jgi:hypothetical protein
MGSASALVPSYISKSAPTDVRGSLSSLFRSRSEAEVESELQEIRRTEEEEGEQAGYRELLEPWVRPMLVVGIGLAVFQRFVGINTVI